MIPEKAIRIVIDLWPMLILISVVLVALRLTYLLVNKKKIVIYKELLSLSFIIYIVLLFELVTNTDFESYSNNFIPFREIFRYSFNSKLFYRNVIGNIMIFVPFGFLTSYYCKIDKKWYLSILITFITSITIEFIQMGIGRSFDVDDILLNIVGGFLGYIVYVIAEKIFKKYSDKFKNNFILNILCFLIILFLVLVILSLYGVVL